MIAAMIRMAWLNLRRDRVALLLTFVLPIVFFSIFASIFGSSGGGGFSPPVIALVDLDGSESSRRYVEALTAADSGLDTRLAPSKRPDRPFDRDEAVALARQGKIAAAVILPEGFGAAFEEAEGSAEPVELIYDEANPIASNMVGGLLQRAAASSAPELMMRRGMKLLERYGGPLTSSQRQAMGQAAPFVATAGGSSMSELVSVRAVSVQGERDERQRKSIIAFYAAGTAVMFLLFSMAGAGGAILEEQESGALDRLLMSNLGMGRLIVAKWIFVAALGAAQVTIMFVWGALVFGIDLFTPSHLIGFAVMTTVTAAAAAGFGMLLATACRSRAQLSGVATIVILVMSAVGGSMFPRFLMPETFQKLGLATFNGWALDGYLKVFWYEDPDAGLLGSVLRLWPQVLVLAALCVAFLVGARLLARRWETL